LSCDIAGIAKLKIPYDAIPVVGCLEWNVDARLPFVGIHVRCGPKASHLGCLCVLLGLRRHCLGVQNAEVKDGLSERLDGSDVAFRTGEDCVACVPVTGPN
jgi:hypothetical protein